MISKTVNLLSHQQRVEVLAQMKVFHEVCFVISTRQLSTVFIYFFIVFLLQAFIHQYPGHARELLTQNPQLAHTLLHLQLLFGMVKPADIQAMQQV